MMTIHFKLAADKTDQSGRCPIFLMAYYNGQRFKHATGEKCDPKQWDENKQIFRRSYSGYQEANTSLEKLEERCRQAYRSYMDQGIIPSATLLKNEIAARRVTTPSNQTYPLISFFEQYVQRLEASDKKYNTIRAYKTTLFRLRQYDQTGRKLFVDGYTQQAHEHLMDYCRIEANLQPNSIFSVCKHLKAFFRYCADTLEMTLHPRHARIIPRYVEMDRIFLTEADLNRIKAVPLSVSMQRVRDAFLFACYTGLRYSDWSRLTLQHVQDKGAYKVLSIIPTKTSSSKQGSVKRLEIPLLNEALDIIQKYEGSVAGLVPVLSQQKLNEALKTLGMMAGIDDMVEITEYQKGKPVTLLRPKYTLIGSHTARHTFATLSLMKGVPLQVLQKALGHSDIKITMIYAKVVDEYKNKAILQAWQAA